MWNVGWAALRGAASCACRLAVAGAIAVGCRDSDTVNVRTVGVPEAGDSAEVLDASLLDPRPLDSNLLDAMAEGGSERLDASDADASDGSACCAPSPEPGCCMRFGGYNGNNPSNCGGVICDNMPLPSAPWQLGVDDHGCPIWIAPEETNDCCGCPADGGLF